MTQLEFDVVLSTLNINNVSSNQYSKYGTARKVYAYNGVYLSFSGTYFAVVNGYIPLEVANLIYEKYPNNQYGIRVDGGSMDWNPKYFAEGNHIKTYHINTKEGLIIFLTELQDYMYRKNYIKEVEVNKINNYIADICSTLVKKINPMLSHYDWIKNFKKGVDSYFITVDKSKKTSFSQLFRSRLEEFDKVVNPFINNSVILKDQFEYTKKVNIGGNIGTYLISDISYKYSELSITDIETNNSTFIYNMQDGFFYQLNYHLDNNKFLSVNHYYSATSHHKLDEGEVIEIKYWESQKKLPIVIKYNLTFGTICNEEEIVRKISPEQKEMIYDELENIIDKASDITINNMQKEKGKVL